MGSSISGRKTPELPTSTTFFRIGWYAKISMLGCVTRAKKCEREMEEFYLQTGWGTNLGVWVECGLELQTANACGRRHQKQAVHQLGDVVWVATSAYYSPRRWKNSLSTPMRLPSVKL